MTLGTVVSSMLLAATVAGPATAQVQVDVNPTVPLTNTYFRQISSVGWYFTPASSFFLTMIQTRFNTSGPNADRTVTAELWSDVPGTGSLLRSGGFQSANAIGTFGGTSFAPILLQSGLQYFIGFRNVQGLGFNTTLDPFSTSLGATYFSLGPISTDDAFETSYTRGDVRNPSLHLEGFAKVSTVPEPATMVLLATGLVALSGVGLIRRRRARRH